MGKKIEYLIFPFLLAVFSFCYSGESSAGEHYDKGVEYASEGKFIEARSEFKEALKSNPRDSLSKNSLKLIEAISDLKIKKQAAMHVFKGAVLNNRRMYEGSIAEFTKAIEIDAGSADAYYNRGLLYKFKGQYDRAISDFSKAVKLEDTYADVYNSRGVAYFQKGHHDLALSDYTKAIEIDPKHVSAYNNRGTAYSKNGQHDRAISDYTKAIEIDPKDASAYINRGIEYFLSKGEKGKACNDWKSACDLGACGHYDRANSEGLCRVAGTSSNEVDAETYYRRGIAFNKERQHESAIQAYSKSIDLNPMHDRAYNNRGLVYSSKGEYDKAIQDFSKAIELKPNNIYAYNNRGLAYSDKRQYDRAIQDYNKALELSPLHADAYYNRGIAYGEKRQYDRAIQDYSKAIDLNPKYAPAFINRGLLYIQKLNDKKRGCSDWKHAYELGIPSHYILSKKKGDCE